jgi:sec-independent protein translocase protein TatA
LVIFALVIVLVFGSRRLPEIGRSLGTGMKEFKQSITAHHEQLDQQEITAAASELPDTTGGTTSAEPRERDAI